MLKSNIRKHNYYEFNFIMSLEKVGPVFQKLVQTEELIFSRPSTHNIRFCGGIRNVSLSLNCQSQQLSSALSSACDIKSHFCKQCGPRSYCSFRSSLIWVHTVCLYANIGLKSLQEYSADDINRRHFQMQVFLAFEGLIYTHFLL